MYKFFLYFILTVSYLGLAKALSPSEIGVQYLQNERAFKKIVPGSNEVTLILVDTHATGFLIKTYYQKYRYISGYTVDELIVRTSKEFAKKNLKNIGLSLYRRYHDKEEFLPLPPGSLYLNNREFGQWKTKKSGETVWRFNRSFKNFPKYLGWGSFRPGETFFEEMRSHAASNVPYYGPHGEFGINGKITRENFPHFFKNERMKKVEMKTLLIEYLKENF